MSSPRRPRAAEPLGIALIALLACLVVAVAASPARALEADQLALVANAKVPGGRKLAEFYAQQRHVPDGRILELDLPDGDEIPFAQYNEQVVPAVRKFLHENGLERKVTCLVTFYGVPLRVGRRVLAPAEADELKAVNAEAAQAQDRAKTAIERLEALARTLDPTYKPPVAGDELPKLPPRADGAVQFIVGALDHEPDPARRAPRFAQMLAPVETLYGPLETTQRLSRPPFARLAPQPPTPEQLQDLQVKLTQTAGELNALEPHLAGEAAARATLRRIVRERFGAFGDLNVSFEQKVRLMPDETESAVDSELSLLWHNGYPRFRWQQNPLYYRTLYAAKAAAAVPVRAPEDAAAARLPAATRPAGTGGVVLPPLPVPTLMVSRLDAPTEQLVHDLIVTSVEVERQGLQGRVALDARGKPSQDPYGVYDQTIRDLGDLLARKTKLDVVLDDKEPLFAPHSVKNVALYCGWYSLRNYVPGMSFARGAVGFHVASLELVSLHGAQETGWVHGLMIDGVAGTLGPVAEPYLHSFPPADEYFPLLLTGRLTLAEVYWLTTPLTSWMQACVGDPLYTPYKANPPLSVEDLPLRLHVIFE